MPATHSVHAIRVYARTPAASLIAIAVLAVALAFVCAFLFLVPLLRTLSGRADVALPSEHALLGSDLPENDERADYLRARLSRSSRGALVATPFPQQDSSMTRVLAEADCLVLREPHAPRAPAGSPCVILKLPL